MLGGFVILGGCALLFVRKMGGVMKRWCFEDGWYYEA